MQKIHTFTKEDLGTDLTAHNSELLMSLSAFKFNQRVKISIWILPFKVIQDNISYQNVKILEHYASEDHLRQKEFRTSIPLL